MIESHGPATVLIAHPGAELYGSDRILLETVEGLCDGGARVVVVLPTDGPLVAEVRARGGVVLRCPTPVLRKDMLRPMGAARFLYAAARGTIAGIGLLRRTRPDVVVANTLTVPLWVALGRLTGRPVLCHVHEGEQSAPALMRRMLAAPLLLADRIVVNSRFTLDVHAANFPSLRDKATVVYNGIVGPAQLVEAREVIVGAARLLYFGRLSPRKGPGVALDALSVLIGRGVDTRLELVGSVYQGYEWFKKELAEKVAADPALRGRVAFHEFVPDIWPHVARCDIVLVPACVDEGYGNTAVEAMLGARPAVVSAMSGLLEATDGYESVARVPVAEPNAVADAVTAILSGWPHYRTVALADSARAGLRHAPERYRQEMMHAVAQAGRARAPRGRASGPRPQRDGRIER